MLQIKSNSEISFNQFQDVLNLVQTAYASMPVPGTLDTASASMLIAGPMAGAQSGFVAIATEESQQPVGVLVGGVFTNALEGGTTIAESRLLHGEAKAELVNAFEQWATKQGAKEVYVAVPGGSEFRPHGWTTNVVSFGKRIGG